MSITVALTVFALILPAELPDKTMVATIVLSTRFQPMPVWLGVVLGFAVQTAVAVAAGGAVSLLPSRLVHAVTAALFAVGAVLMLRGGEDITEEEREFEAELGDEPRRPTFRRELMTSFLVLFAAEWGDLSQILTANFAAKYGDPIAVFVGAWAALALVAALGVAGGRTLVRVVPLVWVRRVAAVLFAAMAVVTAVEAARG
ncbi:MAG: TMEM165/GDT1 family protein [Frankiales bacterium]|nr:TMEM165/GDT1 family protein [Frankiales bacterium]